MRHANSISSTLFTSVKSDLKLVQRSQGQNSQDKLFRVEAAALNHASNIERILKL